MQTKPIAMRPVFYRSLKIRNPSHRKPSQPHPIYKMQIKLQAVPVRKDKYEGFLYFWVEESISGQFEENEEEELEETTSLGTGEVNSIQMGLRNMAGMALGAPMLEGPGGGSSHSEDDEEEDHATDPGKKQGLKKLKREREASPDLEDRLGCVANILLLSDNSTKYVYSISKFTFVTALSHTHVSIGGRLQQGPQ